jgi:RNA polymerase sigma factor (sigma-70 family)
MGETGMTGESQGAVLRGIERIFNQGSLTGLSEGQLLHRFATGDQGAFEALVARHGPTVLGVCRRMLHDSPDVEDAFQATFLVLLRKAGALRDAEALSPWLHGVAYRVAARIRSHSARRPAEESKSARPEAVESACDLEGTELRALLDEEIGHLPEKYRRAVVLCYLEGRTHEEAARRLRCSAGSLRGRLDRARQKLKDRLIRRGVAPAAALAALAAGGEATAAAVAVPAPLVAATVATLARAATARAVSAAGSTAALELADGVFRSMVVAKFRLAAWLVVGILASGMLPLGVALELAPPAAQAPPRAAVAADRGLTVTGRVLDDAGRPIAGARVARGSDLRGQESVPEAATNADGQFVMNDVPPGPVVLTVQAHGHEPDLKTMKAGPGAPPVEFRLGPAHAIRGRIVDAHDKPIAGAPIAADEWRAHHSLRWNTRTDAEGRFRWDDAPADGVQIDLGALGFTGKRFWTAMPDAPEKTITMRRALHVRGRVTDAETGRPITAYTLVPGHTWDDGQNVWWEQDRAKEVKGLSYDVSLSTSAGLQVMRIEAEGYLPATSRAMKDDEDEPVVHFALKRGAGIAGVVRLPDGSPPAGAEVMLATSERPVFLNNGRPTQGAVSNQWVARTRADGRFSLPPQDPPYSIVVLHDRGYALHHVIDRPTVPPELRLRPWSRVEGTLRIGRQPAASQPLTLARGQRPFLPQDIHWSAGVTTDAEGRFTLERVVPGEVQISRMIPIGPISSGGGSPSATVDVAPGSTTRLTLGGTGRPLVGKAVLPAELASRDDWLYDFCYLIRKPTAADLKVPEPFRRPVESYVFKVEPDGSFRIEDIGAGTYEILLNLNKKPVDEGGIGHEPLASVRRQVHVPPMPGGRSDEPLDLGSIPLAAVAKSKPTPPASKP